MHRHNVNVRAVHPVERRQKKFRYLRDEHEKDENEKENHLCPVTTKTSSSRARSTAGSEQRLTVQFADTKSLHRSDKQSRRENSADTGSINFLSWFQIRLF